MTRSRPIAFPLPPWLAVILTGSSGLLTFAAFPPVGWWWLAFAGVALLTLSLLGQGVFLGALLGLVHGLTFFIPLLQWSGLYVGAFPWLTLASFEALYFAAMGAALAVASSVLAQRPRWLLPVLVASFWVAQEAVRSRIPFGGFPWGRLAFSQADSPLLPWAIIGGAPLVSCAVALCGGWLAYIVWALVDWWHQAHQGEVSRIAARVSTLAIGVVGIAAVILVGSVIPTAQPTGEKVTVAVVQGNVPRAGLDFNAQRRQVLENHVEATLDLANRAAKGEVAKPDLVIWPENSSDIDPLKDETAATLISWAADAVDVPILIGAVLDGPGRYASNAGIVWHPQNGPGEQYIKRHPVPFAEYVPFRSVVRSITTKVDLVKRDFAAGHRPGILSLGPARIGDVICFEVAYDGLVADTVRPSAGGGAQLLVVQTNNATFGRSAESDQQLAMVRLRAVEHGRFAVMASTSGISAMIRPDGTIMQSTELFTSAALVDSMRLSTQQTLATRLDAWPERAITVIASMIILAALWELRLTAAFSGLAARSTKEENL